MAKLSPAAQAVLDAFNTYHHYQDVPLSIAAALYAAADQVVPEEEEPVPDVDSVLDMQIWAAVAQRQRTRRLLLTIAAELEQPEPEFTAEEVEMIQAPWSYLSPSQPTSGADFND